MLAGLALVLVATVSLFTFVTRYAVLRPVSRLAEQVGEVARGDFERRLRVDRPAELAELSDHVDAMRGRIVAEWRGTTEARQRLREQAAELRRYNAELERFAYVAGHDPQEPLRKIAGFTRILEQRYGERLDDRAKQDIHFAVDGAKRMHMLINDLLGFSRVSREDGEITAVECSAPPATALGNLAAQIEDMEAGVTADAMPMVMGNRPPLAQLFQNMIGNALKFRSEQPPRIHVDAARIGRMWEFSCSDNWIGVAGKHPQRDLPDISASTPARRLPGNGHRAGPAQEDRGVPRWGDLGRYIPVCRSMHHIPIDAPRHRRRQ